MFLDFNWEQFLLYLLIGFFAQIVDGSLGMAYGVSANALLLSTGISPVMASASVHISEVFTTLASGISHFKFKNVDKTIISQLIIPGVLGGVVGAYLLSSFPVDIIKPIITIYLLLMGIRILIKAFLNIPWIKFTKLHFIILGLVGGFFDAVGGGGWGPIVTSTLLGRDDEPRKVIGSVNISEFFVTFSEAVTFIAILGTAPWSIVLGLIGGGIIAAPLAAFLTAKIANRTMFIIVGSVIIILQIRAILGWFGIQTF
jgi:uncharacterized membrane protein YfcA